MKYIYSILFAFLFALSPINVFADDPANSDLGGMTHQDFQNSLNSYGISYNIKNNAVEILVDQNKSLESVPAMQASGMMNPDISQTEINMNPVMYSGMIGFVFSGLIINDIYKNTNSDKLTFKAYLSVPDDYGNLKRHLIYSFNFNRSIYQKINWNNFSTNGIAKVAPNFKFSNWYSSQA